MCEAGCEGEMCVRVRCEGDPTSSVVAVPPHLLSRLSSKVSIHVSTHTADELLK